MRAFLLAAIFCLASAPAYPHPKQIILMRHAEKIADPVSLCATGYVRAEALMHQYLGKGATESLFGGERPAAFYAITGHTIATIKPTAESWGMEVITPSTNKGAFADKESRQTAQTRDAAKDVLTNPAYDGRIVVMTWEHKHIANKELQEGAPDATLRQLLHLDALDAEEGGREKIPNTWSRSNYDYFWIVDYANPANEKPTRFRAIKQEFAPPYRDRVPHNAWKDDGPAELMAGCKT